MGMRTRRVTAVALAVVLGVATILVPTAAAASTGESPAIDPGYGSDGVARIGDRASAFTGSMRTLDDGSVVMTTSDSAGNLSVVKLDGDGVPDATFGTGGTVDVGLSEIGRRGGPESGLAVGDDGRIYVAGSTTAAHEYRGETYRLDAAAVVVVDADGGTVSDPRLYTTGSGWPFIARGVDVEVDGGDVYLFAIVDYGWWKGDVGVQRMDLDLVRIAETRHGLFGAGPGVDGLVTDDRVVIAARWYDHTKLIAYDRDLGRDLTFGREHRHHHHHHDDDDDDDDDAHDHPDGDRTGWELYGPTDNRPALAGAGGNRLLLGRDGDAVATVERLLPDGSLDPTFGVDGQVALAGGSPASWVSLAPTPDGVLAGARAGTDHLEIVRLSEDGSLDTSFSPPDGIVTVDSPDGARSAVADGGDWGAYASTTSEGDTLVVRIGGASVREVTTSIEPQTAVGTTAGRRHTDSWSLAGALALTDGGDSSIQTSPYRLNAYRLNPYRLNPYRLNGWSVNPFADNPLLASQPVGEFPLLTTPGWSERFVGSRWESQPPLTVTWGDLFDATLDPGEADPLAGLTLADLAFEESMLADASAAAFALIGVPVEQLPEPEGGWCAYLADQSRPCPDLGATSLLDLELDGADLGGYLATPMSLAPPTDVSGSPLATASLLDVALDLTIFGAMPTSELGDFLDPANCAGGGCDTLRDAQLLGAEQREESGLDPTRTVGELIAAVLDRGLVADVTLAQVLGGFAPTGEVPLDRLPRDAILDQSTIDPDRTYRIVTAFVLECTGRSGDLTVTQTPSSRSRVVPETSTLRIGTQPETAIDDPEDGSHTIPGSVCPLEGPQTVTLTAEYESGETLGTFSASSAVQVGNGDPVVSEPATLAVIDGPEPTDDQPATGTELEDGIIVAGHISHAGDEDFFTFDVPPDLPVGSRITASLTHLPADYDLALAGENDLGDVSAYRLNPYRLNPYRLNPYRLNPYRLNVLEDNGDEPGFDEASATPEIAGDIPLIASLDDAGTVRTSSTNRDRTKESVSTTVFAGDPGTTITIGVGGYDGAYDEEPYLLQLTVDPAPPLPDCIGPQDNTTDAPGTLPSLPVPADAETLILVAPSRMPGAYLALAEQVAAHDTVNGVVLPVDGRPAVQEAYEAWDADPCDVSARNAVVEQIMAVVYEAIGDNTELRHVVVVGSDIVLPQFATIDETSYGNEAEHALEALSDGGLLNQTSAALGGGYVLTDDAFGSMESSEGIGGDVVHRPVVAVGRVVEDAADAAQAMQDYLDRNGMLVASESFTAGYDFLADGATAIHDAVDPAVDGTSTLLLDADAWTAGDAADGLEQTEGFTSINAHYDQTNMLPADDSEVLSTTDPDFAGAMAGSVVFTSGCHAGLSIADQVSADAVKTQDWAQETAEQGALFIGNTGYGYGDDVTVAGSEALFAIAAENLASGQMSVGQAFMFAKQQYLAGEKQLTPIAQKVATEVSMFGLPMYTVNGGTIAPSALGDEPDAGTAETTFELTPSATVVPGEEGSYVTTSASGFDDSVQATTDRPLSWNLSKELEDDIPLKGVVLESLTTVDGAPVVPEMFTPFTTGLGGTTPDRSFSDMVFPTQLVDRRGFLGPNGHVQQAIVAGVQWYADDTVPDGMAIPRMVTGAELTTYQNSSADDEPPIVVSADAYVVGDPGGGPPTAVIEADVTGGAVEGFALYRSDVDPDGAPWRRAEFVDLGDGRFATSLTDLPVGTTQSEHIDQFGDASQNWAWSSGKWTGHFSEFLPGGGEGPAVLVASEPPGPLGVYESAPTVSLQNAQPGVSYVVRVDGSALSDYTGAIAVPDTEGVHVVEFTGDDGSFGALAIVVDRSAPTILFDADPPLGEGFTPGPVTLTFRCADVGAGVASCPDPVTITESGTYAFTATDRSGRSTTLTVEILIDDVAPTIVAVVDPEANENDWHNDDVTVSFECADEGGSGVASCPDPVVVTDEGTTVVEGQVVDGAGNSATTTAIVNIDFTDPEGEITSDSTLFPGDQVEGTAFDALSGVDFVEVTYEPQLGGESSTADADLECESEDGACTWSADAPTGLGTYTVTVRIVDRAGNVTIRTQQLLISLTPDF